MSEREPFRHPNCAVVILAAGQGARLGNNIVKPLLDWFGQPLVVRAARVAQASGARRCMVVVGHAATQLQEALVGENVEILPNLRFAEGMATSLQTGISALLPDDDIGAAVFMLVDQPRVEADVLTALMRCWAHTGAALVAPRFQGIRSSPTLISRRLWPTALALRGDAGGRSLFNEFADEVAWVDWPHDITPDIDTLQDYHRLKGH